MNEALLILDTEISSLNELGIGHELYKVRDAFAALIVERDALRADAARLDWLEKESRTSTVYMDNQHPWYLRGWKLRGPTLRAAIDNARGAK